MRYYPFIAVRLVPDNGAWKPVASEATARCVGMATIVVLKLLETSWGDHGAAIDPHPFLCRMHQWAKDEG